MSMLVTIIRPIKPISMNTSGAEVRELFATDTELRFVPVHDDDNLIIGVIERVEFLSSFSVGFYRELYERRAILPLVKSEFISLTLDSSIEDAARAINSVDSRSNPTGAVIFTGTRCVGIVETGAVYRALTSLLDQKAQQLDTARFEAEAASQAKSNFLAAMSHEIRTPLNGVLGMAQALALTNLQPDQLNLVDVIKDSGDVLLRLLDDVLDMSKIDAGKLSLEKAPTDVRALLITATSLYRERAHANNIGFHVCIEDVPEGLFMLDSARLKQVLYNIVSNAVKFTTEGSVSIVAALAPGIDGAFDMTISVSDTGIGMNEDAIGRLFQPFEQADTSTTRKFGGTGLGLSICRSLLTLMGGEVLVTSTLGVGSRFEISLTTEMAEGSSDSLSTSVPQRQNVDDTENTNLQILAAEDNQTNRLVLKTLLASFNIDLTFAENGLLAVECSQHKNFDLILMDLQMPVMGGLDATRAIRSYEASLGIANVPILALSSNAMPYQIAECLAAGMNGHVAKPIELTKLLTAIENATCPEDEMEYDQLLMAS